jgi:hypothetical protein
MAAEEGNPFFLPVTSNPPILLNVYQRGLIITISPNGANVMRVSASDDWPEDKGTRENKAPPSLFLDFFFFFINISDCADHRLAAVGCRLTTCSFPKAITTASLLSGGRVVVTGGGRLRFFHVEPGVCLVRSPMYHTSQIRTVVVSPDQHLIIAISMDCAEIWKNSKLSTGRWTNDAVRGLASGVPPHGSGLGSQLSSAGLITRNRRSTVATSGPIDLSGARGGGSLTKLHLQMQQQQLLQQQQQQTLPGQQLMSQQLLGTPQRGLASRRATVSSASLAVALPSSASLNMSVVSGPGASGTAGTVKDGAGSDGDDSGQEDMFAGAGEEMIAVLPRVFTLLKGVSPSRNLIDFSTDGRLVLMGDMRGTLMLWDAFDAAELTKIIAHSSPAVFARLTPDQNWVVSAHPSGGVAVMSSTTSANAKLVITPSSPPVRIHALKDSQTMVLGLVNGDVELRVLCNAKEPPLLVHTWDLGNTVSGGTRVVDLAITSDQRFAVVAHENQWMSVIALGDARPVIARTFLGSPCVSMSLAEWEDFGSESPRGLKVAVVCQDNMPRVFDIRGVELSAPVVLASIRFTQAKNGDDIQYVPSIMSNGYDFSQDKDVPFRPNTEAKAFVLEDENIGEQSAYDSSLSVLCPACSACQTLTGAETRKLGLLKEAIGLQVNPRPKPKVAWSCKSCQTGCILLKDYIDWSVFPLVRRHATFNY